MLDYRMHLAIAHNPHVKNPQELWDTLQLEERMPTEDVFDRTGFDRLRNMMSKGELVQVK